MQKLNNPTGNDELIVQVSTEGESKYYPAIGAGRGAIESKRIVIEEPSYRNGKGNPKKIVFKGKIIEIRAKNATIYIENGILRTESVDSWTGKYDRHGA